MLLLFVLIAVFAAVTYASPAPQFGGYYPGGGYGGYGGKA